jgi:acyl carrier protein
MQPIDSTADGDGLMPEIAELIVSALNLETMPDQIDPDAALFGEGLGLDSIDILEIALVISKRYGIQLRSDDKNNTQIFGSLRQLCAHVAASRLPRFDRCAPSPRPSSRRPGSSLRTSAVSGLQVPISPPRLPWRR